MAKQVRAGEVFDLKTGELIDLKKKKIFDLAMQCDDLEWTKFEKRCSFSNFFDEAFDSPIVYGDLQLFSAKDGITVILDGSLVYVINDKLKNVASRLAGGSIDLSKQDVVAIWISMDHIFLLNGDMQFTDSQYNYDKQKYENQPSWGTLHRALGKLNLEKTCPTVSLLCLSQFYDSDKIVYRKFNNGELAVWAFEFDDSIPVTKAVKEKIAAAKKKGVPAKINPPKLGYTLVDGKWHRPGAVLFYDSFDSCNILLGQDEGTYFGVELQGTYETINAAIDSLIPAEARGKQYQRQGEWFIVPVDPKIVPEEKDCLAICNDGAELPRETPDSNTHYVRANEIRFTKDGKFFALDPELDHDQHSSVESKGWCTFYKNTALRSYSQEGVD